MRILGIVLTLAGALNLLGAPFALRRGSPLDEVAVGVILSTLAVAIGLGVLRKHLFAWKAGFLLIAVSAGMFALRAALFGVERQGVERLVIVGSAVFGSVLIAAFWMAVWKRQKGYFLPEAAARMNQPAKPNAAEP